MTNNKPQVVVEFDKVREILAATHVEAPRLLARQWELAHQFTGDDVDAQLEACRKQYQAVIRRRDAADVEALSYEARLQAERQQAQQEVDDYADQAKRESDADCDAAANEWLLRVEKRRLKAEALGKHWDPPPPPVRLLPTAQFADDTPRIEPIRVAVQPEIDAETRRLTTRLGEIDAALSLIRSIHDGKEEDDRQRRLAMLRNTPLEQPGVFRVVKPGVRCLRDGLDFEVGALIDANIMGHGNLQRLTAGMRFVVPADSGGGAAA
jgi:hypothetical protein